MHIGNEDSTERGRVFVKVARPIGKDGLNERWAKCEICPTLNIFDLTGDVRAIVLIKEHKRMT